MSARAKWPWTRTAGHIVAVWAVAAWPTGFLWSASMLHPYTPPVGRTLPLGPPRYLWQLCLLPAEVLIAAGLAIAVLSRGRWWTVLEGVLAIVSGLALYVVLDFVVLMAF